MLVGDRGWWLDEYERWLARSFIDAVAAEQRGP